MFGLSDSLDEIAGKLALSTSTLHGSNHWVTGRSMVSPRGLTWCATTSTAYLRQQSVPCDLQTALCLRARTRSVASSTTEVLKSLGGKSAENVASRDVEGTTSEGLAPPNTDLSRLWFGPDQDVAEAVFSSSPRSLSGL
ncbi:hypothetical protein OG21DRAFT_1500237 [Imleria badia]|nr:hypothetical protein OG21DRAFT_1500237 [Imleria badia]